MTVDPAERREATERALRARGRLERAGMLTWLVIAGLIVAAIVVVIVVFAA
jgi:hypothetical protein